MTGQLARTIRSPPVPLILPPEDKVPEEQRRGTSVFTSAKPGCSLWPSTPKRDEMIALLDC